MSMKALDERVLATLRQWTNASAHYIRDELRDQGHCCALSDVLASLERLQKRKLVKQIEFANNLIWKLNEWNQNHEIF